MKKKAQENTRLSRSNCRRNRGAFSLFQINSFVIALALLAAATPLKATVLPNQLDNFQDGSLDNWAVGAAATILPTNIATGGPLGVGDHFLQIGADGSGGSGKLTIFNRTQWPGDYVDQGINEIDLSLDNLSSVTLTIRIAFKSDTSGSSPGYVSQGFTLAPNSGWQNAQFLITPAAMTGINTPAAFTTFFTSSIAEMRIINESTPANLDGVNVTGTLGIDNIHAIPEPNATTLFLIYAGAFALVQTWRRRDAYSTSPILVRKA